MKAVTPVFEVLDPGKSCVLASQLIYPQQQDTDSLRDSVSKNNVESNTENHPMSTFGLCQFVYR